MPTAKAEAYIRKIKNDNKREYARKYATWLSKGSRGDSPDKGELSAMAAQSVRMNLRELM